MLLAWIRKKNESGSATLHESRHSPFFVSENLREHELLAPAAAGRLAQRPRGPATAGRHLRRLGHRRKREQVWNRIRLFPEFGPRILLIS